MMDKSPVVIDYDGIPIMWQQHIPWLARQFRGMVFECMTTDSGRGFQTPLLPRRKDETLNRHTYISSGSYCGDTGSVKV